VPELLTLHLVCQVLAGKKRYGQLKQAYVDAAHHINTRSGAQIGDAHYVHPHQVQATTWLVRQRLNNEEDSAEAKSGSAKLQKKLLVLVRLARPPEQTGRSTLVHGYQAYLICSKMKKNNGNLSTLATVPLNTSMLQPTKFTFIFPESTFCKVLLSERFGTRCVNKPHKHVNTFL
jgi:hypothetical protein